MRYLTNEEMKIIRKFKPDKVQSNNGKLQLLNEDRNMFIEINGFDENEVYDVDKLLKYELFYEMKKDEDYIEEFDFNKEKFKERYKVNLNELKIANKFTQTDLLSHVLLCVSVYNNQISSTNTMVAYSNKLKDYVHDDGNILLHKDFNELLFTQKKVREIEVFFNEKFIMSSINKNVTLYQKVVGGKFPLIGSVIPRNNNSIIEINNIQDILKILKKYKNKLNIILIDENYIHNSIVRFKHNIKNVNEKFYLNLTFFENICGDYQRLKIEYDVSTKPIIINNNYILMPCDNRKGYGKFDNEKEINFSYSIRTNNKVLF